MLSVGGSVMSGLLQLRLLQVPLRRVCSAVIHRKSPASGLTWSVPLSLGLPSVYSHRSPVRTASGVGGGDAGGTGVSGWYSGLVDSAPVHMCEHFLVSVQQVEALQGEISELAKRLRYEVSVRARERGWTNKQSRLQFKKNLRRIVTQLYIRDNCHPFKASLLVWVQLPLWISLSLALRNLSLDQSALQCDLAAGGTLWFPDLTSPDSTWILPVCLGLTNLLIVEVFSLQRVNPSRFQKLLLNSIRGFSVLMIPIAATVPSSMALYWFASSLLGFSHNLLLRSPWIHKILKLQTHQSDSPYRDLLSAFINKYCK
ncbi:cytochrome c oxidase assembly protein COX18, mitochondrial isoform X2 [Xiphias gladius]|uniref:cytochrome c oxidase assembly protein COX18, mitochondrial isoform X2 n=1 Tax=Xiphias gladius TaxID=8245 RepID=UPI001A9881C9|nr:cytochrome c oxidase assembly protein COX18, mitochondrial isoform X2 [Xiphias gladius]